MTHPKGQGQGSCHRQSSKHTVSSLRRLFERRSKQNGFYLLGFYLLALCLTLIYFSNLRKLSTTTKYRGWRQENVATWKVFLVQIWANFTGIPSQTATHKQNNSGGGVDSITINDDMWQGWLRVTYKLYDVILQPHYRGVEECVKKVLVYQWPDVQKVRPKQTNRYNVQLDWNKHMKTYILM